MKKHSFLSTLFATFLIISLVSISGCSDKGGQSEGATSDATTQTPKVELTENNAAILAGKKATYSKFNQADYQAALKSDKLVVLYHYATWCPLCKAERKELFAAFDELNTSDVVGFEVHFNDSLTTDEHREIAREFGVAYQHTKIFIKDGKRILKAPDTWNKDRYLKEIEKALQ